MSFSSFSIMLAVGIFVNIPYQVEEVSLNSYFTEHFYDERVLDFIKRFSASI